ncbi:MAG TPA: hypothetical protein VEI52_02850 [Terriglobales bacterium]|nr:hypothetical protein [Terriglobales bacterium]
MREKVVSIDVGRQSGADVWSDESPESVLSEMHDAAKPKLLGLPCARCHMYYDADLTACPRCGFTERERLGDSTAMHRKAA